MELDTKDTRGEFSIFNTDDELSFARDVVGKVQRTQTLLGDERDTWAKCETQYLGKQIVKKGTPGTKVNVTMATVEGQSGDLATKDISVVCIGQSENDHEFAEQAKTNLEWDLRHQEDLFGVNMDAARRLLKFGTLCLKVNYDPYAFDDFGVPRIDAPALDRVILDPKVLNPRRLQDAEWVAEIIAMSKAEAIRWYGKEKADVLVYSNLYQNELIWQSENREYKDYTYWTLYQYWTKEDGRLRLREYANCNFLLYDSFKGDDRKENQKKNKEKPNSYYTYVDDRYPYVFRTLYPREGKFYGMGDVELISGLQDALNHLYDMIRISSRPNLMLVDSAANIDPEELGEDDFRPINFDSSDVGVNNRDPVRSVPWGQTNQNWWQLVGSIHQEIQRVLRYSDLMLGYSSSGGTATEAAIQQQQGARAVNTKQRIIESALAEAVTYCLGLDLQFRTGVKNMRLKDDSPEYADINFDTLKNIPVMIPAEESTKRKFRLFGNKEPKKQILEKNGKPVTKKIALDVQIAIGAGMPKNTSFLADLANKLAQTLITDKNGQPRPAMSWEEYRKFMRDVVGFPLLDNEEMPSGPPMPMGQDTGGVPPLPPSEQNMSNPMDANSPLAQGGGVPMAPLNAIKSRTA